MSDEFDEGEDATVQIDVRSLEGVLNAPAPEPEPEDGTTQLDRAAIDALIAQERPDMVAPSRSYTVGAPEEDLEDGTTQIDRSEIDALINADNPVHHAPDDYEQTRPEMGALDPAILSSTSPRAAAPTPQAPWENPFAATRPDQPALPMPESMRSTGPKADPTAMVDRSAIAMLQSRDEEHALATQLEKFGVPDDFEDDFDEGPATQLTTPPWETQQQPPRPAPTAPAAANPFLDPPLLEPPVPEPVAMPDFADSPGLSADFLFDEVEETSSSLSPLDPMTLGKKPEPTEAVDFSNMKTPPAKQRSSGGSFIPYLIGVVIVLVVAGLTLAGFLLMGS